MQELKVVLIGDSAVGKTSIFSRMKGDDFVTDQTSTVGGSCSYFEVKTEKGSVNLNMWDTAGQERFRTIVPMYFRKAAVVIIVFDVTKKATFDAIDEWYSLVREKAPENVKIILVGNKTDLRQSVSESVQVADIVGKGESLGAIFSTETSALSGNGIELLKETVALQAFEDEADNAEVESTPNTINVKETKAAPNTSSSSSSCC